ncbi:YeeE/YedE thiosulfate transporter family protein [Acinetobacter bohemicus]|uniref:YeeE/YedE family protein n=1 Tax=Acinetobacter lwoffii TaxID=28090 RepID=A0A9D2USI8_ACILW|nr:MULTISPECIES: YeeE/YedE thiosulfate transporter family protein [Acinetobacter]MDM1781984.1 YeeE/YedE family protein [Acinetobacter indicus]HJF27880.1 YeeE/YedE family protein [Acinetobacter lwoffii]MCO8043498.1 YeeE/YedE family protein [Acinetobacter sp. S4400-12]MCO8044475.1 YeeE/YedE family protein [Acinetobacter sp. S4397-1]MCU7225803.1 YeeE/YedE thiosulfate transporter family protein [Acinetobacter bohemicus]
MHDFLIAFLGGLMLGVSVVGYLYVNGRIAGISGLISQVLNPQTLFKTPALWFMSGLVLTPFLYGLFVQPDIELNASPLMMIIAGLLVGFGTRLGSGCTSGHGICGISRLSRRSIIATLTFMFAGFVIVYIIRHVTGAF